MKPCLKAAAACLQGFYAPVRDALCAALADRSGPLHAGGCGLRRRVYAPRRTGALSPAQVIGLDLNRDAVALAARSAEQGAWFVADLKRLPVENAAADVVLNVFSPADYGEFRRAAHAGRGAAQGGAQSGLPA